MKQNLIIRIKNNLFLSEDKSLLYFQRSYSNGIEFSSNKISKIILTTLNNKSAYKDVVDELVLKLGILKKHVTMALDKMLESGILEIYNSKVIKTKYIERYERQLGFFDSCSPVVNFSDNIKRQEKLKNTHILIIGIGGIGNYAALSYAAMGIGTITLIDGDRVEVSNLSRQILYRDDSIGALKTKIAAEELKKVNPACKVNAHQKYINSQNNLDDILKQLKKIDFVFISADQPKLLPYWVDELAINYKFSFMSCSYQTYTGFVGPIIKPKEKRLRAIGKHKAQFVKEQPLHVIKTNQNFKHPSTSASNAVLANVAVLESIKFILKLGNVNILEKRAVFDLKTLTISYEENLN
ncbi:MAG: ThiF family adenylyltransferase [Bacteroidetes bacterium]|nr:ThiF family adenylyltransferase [Bacteroidota bacterium]